MLASTEYAERIKVIDVESYKVSIRVGLDAAVEMATNEEAKAIYFEYDLDNEWTSQFYICEEYAPLEEEDDDWASEWTYDVEGPESVELADMYNENGFDTSEKQSVSLYI